MTITFDQLLEVIVGALPPEAGFGMQVEAHTVGSIIFEWKMNNLSNAQMATILNLDNDDPELTTIKAHLNTLTPTDIQCLESIMILTQKGISGYNKALLRTRFGLT